MGLTAEVARELLMDAEPEGGSRAMQGPEATGEHMDHPGRRQMLGWAWLAHALALALHVADEAAHDFLSVYNPAARAIRARLGLPFPPVFSFRMWVGGLALAVLALLLCTPLAFSGSRKLAWLGVALGVIMVGNGAGHIISFALAGRALPGLMSSPLLVVCALVLVFAAVRVLRGGAVERPG